MDVELDHADREIVAAVAARDRDIREIADVVGAHPELAHAEAFTSRFLAERLAAAGFAVRSGVGAVPTAFRADFDSGRPGPTVGLVAVYDAVCAQRADGSTEAVHACGHGPQSAGVLGAALALASVPGSWSGKVVVIGCPADEIHSPGTIANGSGKALTVAGGVWADVDAALYAHPEFFDTVWLQSLWMRRLTTTIMGSRTLRAGAASAPMTSLHALLRLADETDPAHVMIETAVLDGDVEEGSPLMLSVRLLLWEATEDRLAALTDEVTGRFPDQRWTIATEIPAIAPDSRVRDAVIDAFGALGRHPQLAPPSLPFATDFADVSLVVPSALIGVGREGGWRFHTDAGVPEFAGADGFELAAGTASVLALTVARLGRAGGDSALTPSRERTNP
jgi:metal-dependent amidase/aminoacylase/carboxypeptidase family protein